MLPSVPALVVIAAEFVTAIAFYPAMRWRGRSRAIAFALAMACAFAAPLCIHPDRRPARLGAALAAAWATSKLYDLHFGVAPRERSGFWAHVVYVFNPFWMVRRHVPPDASRRDDVRRLVVRILLAAVAYALCVAVFHVDWSGPSFAFEHVAKTLTIMSLMIFSTNALAAGWRVAGGRGLDAMGSFPLLAATPAEFWRRWNQPAQQFFRAYGTRPMGGMRRPIRATLWTFAVSAAGHEYIFSVAAGRLQGYQMAFFVIHGLAAVATLRVRPRGWSRLAWWLGTFAFLLVTTVLFGLSANEIVPVYAARRAP